MSLADSSAKGFIQILIPLLRFQGFSSLVLQISRDDVRKISLYSKNLSCLEARLSLSTHEDPFDLLPAPFLKWKASGTGYDRGK